MNETNFIALRDYSSFDIFSTSDHLRVRINRFHLLNRVIAWGVTRYLNSEVPAVDAGLRSNNGSAVRTQYYIDQGLTPINAIVKAWEFKSEIVNPSVFQIVEIILRVGIAGGMTLCAARTRSYWIAGIVATISIYLDTILDWEHVG